MLSEEGGTGHDDVASLQKLKKEIICLFKRRLDWALCFVLTPEVKKEISCAFRKRWDWA